MTPTRTQEVVIISTADLLFSTALLFSLTIFFLLGLSILYEGFEWIIKRLARLTRLTKSSSKGKAQKRKE